MADTRTTDTSNPVASAALDSILTLVGEEPAADEVSFHGADPVLPTPFRIGELGAASIASAALMTSRLFEQRTGRSQRVDVDVDAAAAAMRSSRFLRSDPPVESARARTVGYYPTLDSRYIFMQRLFPHHFARQIEVLGCEPNDDAIAAAAARWDSQELEDAIVAAGACGAVVRTREEWRRHPQSSALAALPLIEIERIGDSDPEPVATGERPLEGLRVLDLTRVLAGPTCARTLAEQGADVLRISSPRMPDDPVMLRDTGHGKRSAVLDIDAVDQFATLMGLAGEASVFSEGYRPGALDARGLGPGDLARIRPGIVYVSISAFGRTGPWAGRRGFDSVVQAASGISDEMGAGGPPRSLPANPLDYTTGYLAAFGALVALGRRAREGGSYHVQVSLGRTGAYLFDLPRTDLPTAYARRAEFAAERETELMISRDTPFGRLDYLAPAARYSETPAAWTRPSVPADYDEAVWA